MLLHSYWVSSCRHSRCNVIINYSDLHLHVLCDDVVVCHHVGYVYTVSTVPMPCYCYCSAQLVQCLRTLFRSL